MKITFERVTKSYDGKPLFSDFSAQFESGETWLLESPSGSGKTTFFRMLLGFEQPDAGTIHIGDDAGKPIRLRAGVVFQEDRLFPALSAMENVRLVNKRLSAGEIRRELSALLPADELDKPVSELSGGMKRRVSLVRACLFSSDALILDEPFAGLEKENARKALRYLQEKSGGKLVFLASHGGERPEGAKVLAFG